MPIPYKERVPRAVPMLTADKMFGKVRAAREILRQRAEEILEQYLLVIKEAQAAGEYEIAAKSLQWLMDHMPEEEGERMVDSSVDKKQDIVQADTRPAINIGINLGGVGNNQKALQPSKPKALPPVKTGTIIDAD